MSILHLHVRVLNCSYFNALNFNKRLINVSVTASVCVCFFVYVNLCHGERYGIYPFISLIYGMPASYYFIRILYTNAEVSLGKSSLSK